MNSCQDLSTAEVQVIKLVCQALETKVAITISVPFHEGNFSTETLLLQICQAIVWV